MPGPMRVDSGQSSDHTVGCIFSHILIAGVLRQSPPWNLVNVERDDEGVNRIDVTVLKISIKLGFLFPH